MQVLLGRLVVSPVATVAVLAAAVRVGLIPATERLLLLFLLMQGATPSAMFLGVMTQMHRDTEREAIMSQLLLVLNIAAIPLFTVGPRMRPSDCRRLLRFALATMATNVELTVSLCCCNFTSLSALPDCSVGFFDHMRAKQRYCVRAGVSDVDR